MRPSPMATPTLLGAYPVERELGRGGMGVVYLARDPRLDRPVAIKVLPDESLARNPERLARFEREARLLASLSHPNIAGDLRHRGGRRLASSCSSTSRATPSRRGSPRGRCRSTKRSTSAVRSRRRSRPRTRAASIHRDLKPGNVMITPDGQVKVLDFGLAKGGAGASSDPDLAQSPTITYAATGAGVILGTAGYMSPEQARGKPVDRRADIWSFGCVLFECLTGRQRVRGRDGLRHHCEDPRARARLDGAAGAARRRGARAATALPREGRPKAAARHRRCPNGDRGSDCRTRLGRDATGAIPAAPLAPSRRWKIDARGWIARRQRGHRLRGLGGDRRPCGQGERTSRRSGQILGHHPADDPRSVRRVDHGASLVLVLGHLIAPTAPTSRGDESTFRRLDRTSSRRYPGPMVRKLPVPRAMESGSPSCSPPMRRRAAARQSASGLGRRHRRRLRHGTTVGSRPACGCRTATCWCSPEAVGVRPPSSRRWPTKAPGQVRLRFRDRVPDVSSSAAWRRACPALTLDVDSLAIRRTSGSWTWRPEGSTSVENAGQAIISPTGHLLFSRGETLMGAPFDLARRAITGEATALVGGLRTSTWGHGGFDLADNGTCCCPRRPARRRSPHCDRRCEGERHSLYQRAAALRKKLAGVS